MKEKTVCSVCGAKLTEENAKEFDGQIMCESCLYEKTVLCDNCQERIWREDAEGDSNYTLCSHCYEYSYTTCEDCGRLIHNEDALYEDGEDYPYCRDCFEKLNSDAIKNYSYKPEPIFYGSGNLFYGVELEIDKGGEEHSNAQNLLDIANKNEERIYCKHDGSINDGFEIVSHPMSLDYSLSRDDFHINLFLLENDTDVPFITCDQPLINTKSDPNSFEVPTELEIYYPQTPQIALILSTYTEIEYSSKVSELEVKKLNDLMVQSSHEQVYSNDKSVLEQYV